MCVEGTRLANWKNIEKNIDNLVQKTVLKEKNKSGLVIVRGVKSIKRVEKWFRHDKNISCPDSKISMKHLSYSIFLYIN